MPNAKREGMLFAFTEKVDRKNVVMILITLSALVGLGWAWFTFPTGLMGLLFCAPLTFWYRRMARKHFGGATGDTTGYYLQITELTLMVGYCMGGILIQ